MKKADKQVRQFVNKTLERMHGGASFIDHMAWKLDFATWKSFSIELKDPPSFSLTAPR